MHFIDIILGQFQIVSQPKYNFISSRNSKTIPNFVLPEFHLHIIEKILRQFQILCLDQNFFASPRNCSETIPTFVPAKFQLHLIENILSQIQIKSWQLSKSISSKIFQDNSQLCLTRNSIASH